MVDLSHLSQPQLKFLTLTHQYREGEGGSDLSLSAFSPEVCIMFARHFSLDTANFEVNNYVFTANFNVWISCSR